MAEFYLARGDKFNILDYLSTGPIDNLRHFTGNRKLTIKTGSVIGMELTFELVQRCGASGGIEPGAIAGCAKAHLNRRVRR